MSVEIALLKPHILGHHEPVRRYSQQRGEHAGRVLVGAHENDDLRRYRELHRGRSLSDHCQAQTWGINRGYLVSELPAALRPKKSPPLIWYAPPVNRLL